MSTKNKVIETLAKPLMVGAIASLASVVLLGGTDLVTTPLGNLPAFVPIGGAIMGASLVAEATKQWVIDSTGNSQMIASIAKPAITGVAGTLAVYLATGGNVSTSTALNTFALGAGSEIGGSYAYTSFVSPYLAPK